MSHCSSLFHIYLYSLISHRGPSCCTGRKPVRNEVTCISTHKQTSRSEIQKTHELKLYSGIINKWKHSSMCELLLNISGVCVHDILMTAVAEFGLHLQAFSVRTQDMWQVSRAGFKSAGWDIKWKTEKVQDVEASVALLRLRWCAACYSF